MRKNFLEALVKLSKVIKTNHIQPFYSSLQLVAEGGILHMYAANEEFDVKAYLGEWDGMDFYFSFHPKMATAFLRKIAKGYFGFDYNPSNHSLILYGDDYQKMIIESSYGTLNDDKESFEARFRNMKNKADEIKDTGISSTMFLEAVKYVSGFMSDEETRYYLNGVFFDGKRNTAVATNGHVLGVYDFMDEIRIPDTDYNENGVIIWNSVIDFIKKEFNPDDQGLGNVYMSKDFTLLQFKSRNMSYTIETRNIEGQFPNYMRVFPDINELHKLSCVVSDFKKKIGNLNSMKAFKYVDISVEDNMKLSSKSGNSEFISEILVVEKDDGYFPIVRLDSKYLQKIADVSEGEYLDFFINPNGPSVFETKNCKVLIMPIKR